MNKNLYKKIILPFIDDNEDEAKYSLSMILKYARWKFAINPGDWFNIGQIAEVIRKLHDDSPLEGCEKLKILFFSQSVIFIDKILEKSRVNKCKCPQKSIICEQCHSGLIEIVN